MFDRYGISYGNGKVNKTLLYDFEPRVRAEGAKTIINEDIPRQLDNLFELADRVWSS
jgi:hypothetical protein